MKQMSYTCIVCPMSCDLELTDDDGALSVKGNTCPRGERYAKNEYTNPQRMITTTVRLTGGTSPLLPVISSGTVPKELLFKCLETLGKTAAKAPVKMNDVIISDIMGTGVDVLAAKSAK